MDWSWMGYENKNNKNRPGDSRSGHSEESDTHIMVPLVGGFWSICSCTIAAELVTVCVDCSFDDHITMEYVLPLVGCNTADPCGAHFFYSYGAHQVILIVSHFCELMIWHEPHIYTH